jgi:hypothetical protein
MLFIKERGINKVIKYQCKGGFYYIVGYVLERDFHL